MSSSQQCQIKRRQQPQQHQHQQEEQQEQQQIIPTDTNSSSSNGNNNKNNNKSNNNKINSNKIVGSKSRKYYYHHYFIIALLFSIPLIILIRLQSKILWPSTYHEDNDDHLRRQQQKQQQQPRQIHTVRKNKNDKMNSTTTITSNISSEHGITITFPEGNQQQQRGQQQQYSSDEGHRRNIITQSTQISKNSAVEHVASVAGGNKPKIIIVDEPYVDLSSDPDKYSTARKFELTKFSNKPSCNEPSLLSSSSLSVTLTTQLSLDRMWIMKHQCQRWSVQSPISVAVYLPSNAVQTAKDVIDALTDLCSETAHQLTITIVKGRQDIDHYPVNVLRNFAFDAVATTHATYIDSDFLISYHLDIHLIQSLRYILQKQQQQQQQEQHEGEGQPPTTDGFYKIALVTPAFEYFSKCKQKLTKQEEALQCIYNEWDDYIPSTKRDVIRLLEFQERNETRPFIRRGYQNYRQKNRFHSTTLYRKWSQSEQGQGDEQERQQEHLDPIPIPCLKTPAYEPYLTVQVCNDLPIFPPYFTGWGFNKVIWIKILLKKFGYQLWQDSQGFVIHMPHPQSVSRRSTGDEESHPPVMKQYMNWLGNQTLVPNHKGVLPDCASWKLANKGLERD